LNILYNEEKTQTDVYRYKVNQGGDLNIKVSNGSDRFITITFVNGKFESARSDLGDFDSRSNWYVFGGIAEQIKKLEKTYDS